VEVVALAPEILVRSHLHRHVEVAGRPAAGTGVAFPCHPHALAVGHARRQAHRHALRPHFVSRRPRSRARPRRLLAGAAAAVAAPREDHVPAHRSHGSLPLADRARTCRRALDARAPARAARLASRQRQRTLAAGETLGKRDRRQLVQVGPACGGRPPGAVLDQYFGHEIAEVAE
jgi:hypothetical protein